MSAAFHHIDAGRTFVPVSPQRLLRSTFLLLGALVLGACTEKLESGAACPSLCPQRELDIVTAELSPVVLDTTVRGTVPFGTEPWLLLARRGDSVETRAVLRFDTLPNRARHAASGDTTSVAITKLDSAYLRIRLDTTGTVATAPITIAAYDVDTTGVPDTATAPLLGLFREDRRIGGITLTPEQLRNDTTHQYVDSLRIPIDTAFLRRRLADSARVRIGLAIVTTGSAQLRPTSAEHPLFPTINYHAQPADTFSLTTLREATSSRTPDSTDIGLNGEFRDYTVTVIPTAPSPPQDLAVGGIPGQRAYLRFDLPAAIVDSATVTRAELLLTQRPDLTSPGANDTIAVHASVVLAGSAVTDPVRAAALIEQTSLVSDSLVVVPAGSGTFRLDITPLIRRWRGLNPSDVPRAIVLRVAKENVAPAEVRFYSSEAADPLQRPRLRISYVPSVEFGLP